MGVAFWVCEFRDTNLSFQIKRRSNPRSSQELNPRHDWYATASTSMADRVRTPESPVFILQNLLLLDPSLVLPGYHGVAGGGTCSCSCRHKHCCDRRCEILARSCRGTIAQQTDVAICRRRFKSWLVQSHNHCCQASGCKPFAVTMDGVQHDHLCPAIGTPIGEKC
jgi:hypothetical protein